MFRNAFSCSAVKTIWRCWPFGCRITARNRFAPGPASLLMVTLGPKSFRFCQSWAAEGEALAGGGPTGTPPMLVPAGVLNLTGCSFGMTGVLRGDSLGGRGSGGGGSSLRFLGITQGWLAGWTITCGGAGVRVAVGVPRKYITDQDNGVS